MKRKQSKTPLDVPSAHDKPNRTFGDDQGWGKDHIMDDIILHQLARKSVTENIRKNKNFTSGDHNAYSFVVYDFRDKGHVQAMRLFKRGVRLDNENMRKGLSKHGPDVVSSTSKIPDERVFYYEDSTEDSCNVCFVAFYKSNLPNNEQKHLNPVQKEIASVLMCRILRPLKNPLNPLENAITPNKKIDDYIAEGVDLSVPVMHSDLISLFPSTYASGNVFSIMSAITRTKHENRSLSVGLHYLAIKFASECQLELNLSLLSSDYVSDAARSIGVNKFQMYTMRNLEALESDFKGDIITGGFKKYEMLPHKGNNGIPVELYPLSENIRSSSSSSSSNWKVRQIEAITEGSSIAKLFSTDTEKKRFISQNLGWKFNQMKEIRSRILKTRNGFYGWRTSESDRHAVTYEKYQLNYSYPQTEDAGKRQHEEERAFFQTLTAQQCYGSHWNTYIGFEDPEFEHALRMMDILWRNGNAKTFKFFDSSSSTNPLPLDLTENIIKEVKKSQRSLQSEEVDYNDKRYLNMSTKFVGKLNRPVNWENYYANMMYEHPKNPSEKIPTVVQGKKENVTNVPDFPYPSNYPSKLIGDFELVVYNPLDSIHRQHLQSYLISRQKMEILDSIGVNSLRGSNIGELNTKGYELINDHAKLTQSYGENANGFIARLDNPCNLTWLLVHKERENQSQNSSSRQQKRSSQMSLDSKLKKLEIINGSWDTSPVLGVVVFHIWYPFHNYVDLEREKNEKESYHVNIVTKSDERETKNVPDILQSPNLQDNGTFDSFGTEKCWSFETSFNSSFFNPQTESFGKAKEERINLQATNKGVLYLQHISALTTDLNVIALGRLAEQKAWFKKALNLPINRREYQLNLSFVENSKSTTSDISPIEREKIGALYRKFLGVMLLMMSMQSIVDNHIALNTPILCLRLDDFLFRRCYIQGVSSLIRLGGMVAHPRAIKTIEGLSEFLNLIKSPCGVEMLLSKENFTLEEKNECIMQFSELVPDLEDWNIFFPLEVISNRSKGRNFYIYLADVISKHLEEASNLEKTGKKKAPPSQVLPSQSKNEGGLVNLKIRIESDPQSSVNMYIGTKHK